MGEHREVGGFSMPQPATGISPSARRTHFTSSASMHCMEERKVKRPPRLTLLAKTRDLLDA